MRYFIGDTETTGLVKAKAVEIAFLEIDPITLDIQQVWSSLIDPEQEIEPKALSIHGITPEMVACEPTIEEFVEVVMGGRIEDPCTLIAHNVRFDKPMFMPVMNVVADYCTLALSRRLHPNAPNHQLGTMKELLGLSGGEAHRALGDVTTVHQLLQALLPTTGKTLLDLLQVPFHTIYTMPFGEHKGTPLMDLPVSYRTYMLSLPNLDSDLRRSFMQLRAAGV